MHIWNVIIEKWYWTCTQFNIKHTETHLNAHAHAYWERIFKNAYNILHTGWCSTNVAKWLKFICVNDQNWNKTKMNG